MLPGDPASLVQAEAGDVIVVPQGETHVLGSATDLVPDVLSRRLSGEPAEREEEDGLRVIGLGSQILRELGVGRMIVLANAPQKLIALDGYGLSIDGWRGFKP